MNVGLLAVRLKYGLYVGYLSKFVTLFRVCHLVNVFCVVSFYACCQLTYNRHKPSPSTPNLGV
jgi:hypothetical protein